MLKLEFYSFKEKLPEIGQEVVYLRRGYSFGREYFEPQEDTVEAQWVELEDGEQGGSVDCTL